MNIAPEIVVAVLALVGTAFGSITGVLAANKMTNFRIEQLERKVEKHNNLIERTAVVERDLKTAFHRIDDIKEDIHNDEHH